LRGKKIFKLAELENNKNALVKKTNIKG